MTKRTLVSDIAKTFDVLGWFSPTIITMFSASRMAEIDTTGAVSADPPASRLKGSA